MSIFRRRTIFVLLCFHFIVAAPTTINYSSFVTDVAKKPRSVSDSVAFRLFSDSIGGIKLWEEMHNVVAPNGFVSVILGQKNAFPVRQIANYSKLFLEMKIGPEIPFSRQKISNSFFSFHSAYTDSAKHAALADSAKTAQRTVKADTAALANNAQSLIGYPGAQYVLQTSLDAYIPDSSRNSGNSDSLGKFPAAAYAKKTDRMDSAKIALRADSVGSFPAGAFALKNGRIDSAKFAFRSDSLGTSPATRYLKTDADGNVGLGTTPAAKLHVLGRTILNGQTILDSGVVVNSGILDGRVARSTL